MNMKSKLSYEKPLATVTILEIEYALAAGSAQVLADDSNMRLFEEWEEEADVYKTIDW